MMLEIAAARKSCRYKIMSDIGFVRFYNVTDGLKMAISQAILSKVLSNGELIVQAQQCIVRN